ncbi:MAG TPA: hypothetical protein VFS92_01795, partial [Planctomycetota bacterium]|nr:hypothetical protein [Planctomycetota bacterium]
LAAGGWLALDERDRRLSQDIDDGVKTQAIDRAYFLAYYRPRDLIEFIRAQPEFDNISVLLADHDTEALPAYLSSGGVEFHGWDVQRKLHISTGPLIIDSGSPQEAERLYDLGLLMREGLCEERTPWRSFDRLLFLRRPPIKR